MKISAAALSFFILAATLGSLALGSLIHEPLGEESGMQVQQLGRYSDHLGIHHPSDCCHSYIRRKIRCKFMAHFVETDHGCYQPGVIFVTNRGQRVCADPSDQVVQDCLNDKKEALDKELRELLG